jgi:hypothetical protein
MQIVDFVYIKGAWTSNGEQMDGYRRTPQGLARYSGGGVKLPQFETRKLIFWNGLNKIRAIAVIVDEFLGLLDIKIPVLEIQSNAKQMRFALDTTAAEKPRQ